MPRVRHRSETVEIDHGRVVYPSLNRFAIVMDLHELAPVGGRATSRRHRRRCERFAKMGQDLPDRPRFADRKSAATGGCQECEGQGWFRTRKAV
jgi:hypothetical protein